MYILVSLACLCSGLPQFRFFNFRQPQFRFVRQDDQLLDTSEQPPLIQPQEPEVVEADFEEPLGLSSGAFDLFGDITTSFK